jgi:hypothetical protein
MSSDFSTAEAEDRILLLSFRKKTQRRCFGRAAAAVP